MKHMLDVNIATEVGANAALIFENFLYWIQRNKTHKENFNDGRYWTYTSQRALEEYFPYLTTNQIRTAIDKLKDKGLIITGNYNKVAYDRTTWYALSDYAESILAKTQIHLGNFPNGTVENPEPIPDINNIYKQTDNKKDIYTSLRSVSISKEVSEIVDYLNLKANTSYRPSTDKTKRLVNARFNEGWTIDDFKTVIDFKVKEWANTSMAMYLRPETLFGTKFESYLNQSKTKTTVYNNPYLNRDNTFDDPDHMWD